MDDHEKRQAELLGLQRTEMVDLDAPRRTESSDEEWALDKMRSRREGTFDPGDDPGAYVYPHGTDGRRDPDAPVYKDADAAHEARQQRAREQADTERHLEQQRAEYDEAVHHERVRQAQSYTPTEDQIVQVGRAHAVQNWNDAHTVLELRAQLPSIAQTNPVYAAELKGKLDAATQTILARNEYLTKLNQAAVQTLQQKQVSAGAIELRHSHAELEDPQFKEGLIQAGMRHYGLTHGEVQKILNNPEAAPAIHRGILTYKQHLQNEKEAAFNDFMRERSRAMGVAWREGGVAGGVPALHQELKRSGSEEAAVAYLMGKRTQAREKRRGRL